MAHHLYLLVSFVKITLVYADSIDPNRSVVPLGLEILEHGEAVLGLEKNIPELADIYRLTAVFISRG
jgi:hypothetical protein